MISLFCKLASLAEKFQFTMLAIGDDQFMVVIQPSIALAKDYPSLSAPLQIVAGSAELEAEVVKAIQEYVPALTNASSNIKTVVDALKKEKDDVAAKAKEKSDAARDKKTKVTAVPGAAAKVAPPPGLPDLFNTERTTVPTAMLEASGGVAGNDADEGQ